MSKKDKKPWSKKKKLTVALSIIAAFLVLVIGAGVIALNWYCDPGEYTISSAADIINEDTKIIAHRGLRGLAPENTKPAFEKAGENGYWGAENDIFRTSDGVWVVQHDFITYRMMDGINIIEKSTYDELLKHNTDNGINIDKYPDLKICTLEEYLEVCESYGMNAVIELKSKNGTEFYSEIKEMVDKYNVDVTYISFHENDLREMRKLDTESPMFYLTSVIDDESIEIAKSIDNCGIDFDGNKEENYENDAAMIKKCKDEGLTLGAWTIDDLDTMKKLIDLGVNYITTNCITY